LRFPLCLATRLPDGELARDGSVARGNLVLADHGLTTDEPLPVGAPLHLPRGPLTQHCAPDALAYDPATGRPRTARYALAGAASAARPAVALRVSTPSGDELWTPVPDLLDSPPFGTHFVAEVDDDGRALLRFGDGEYGRALPAEAAVEAVYRVGNGRAGNVGAEALAHVALPADSQAVGRVIGVRNPLPAQDGEDPETIEAAREWAPQAFRAEQLRAVTEADYVAAAQRLPEVAGAAARFRWTGSWYSVCVAIDPRDPTDLIPDATGRLQLAARLEARVRAHLTRYRLAGYDLEIRAPTFVPLEIDLEVCVASGYFHAEVAHTVADALSNRVLPSGQRGFFHPDRFTFGQSVYLSQLYAAVERVEGVDSAVVRRLRRLGQPDNGELARGVLPIGPWEIALLANDPNFLEQGVLRIVALGGKG